jgi:hypothetical protein
MARAGLPCDGSAGPGVSPDAGTADTPSAAHAPYLWAVLIARIYAILPLLCPVCRSEMPLIAAVTEPEPVRRILLHVGEPTTPPSNSPARSPPPRDTPSTGIKPRPMSRKTENWRPRTRSIKRSVGNLAASDTLSRLAGRVRRSPRTPPPLGTDPEAGGTPSGGSRFSSGAQFGAIPDRSRALTRPHDGPILCPQWAAAPVEIPIFRVLDCKI